SANQEPHKTRLAALAHGHFIVSLSRLNTELREALQAQPPAPTITFKEVQAADVKGQELMLELVATILAQTRNKAEQRALLLGPILAQQENLAQYYANQNPVADVDPETGQELDEDV
ncbi:MAG: hypothetical protein AAFX99_19005, partial [Myxococcota bacterium]